MENYISADELMQMAKVLHELQEQLLNYQTALQKIDGTAQTTQQAAQAVAELTKIIGELHKSQLALAQSYEETRQALASTQLKAEQTRKDFEAITQAFLEDLNERNQQREREFDHRVGKTLLSQGGAVKREVRRLKYFALANMLAVLALFAALFIFDRKPTTDKQNTQLVAKVDSLSLAVRAPHTAQAEESPKAVKVAPTIQILNGCGVPKVAELFQTALQNANLKVERTTNADHFNYTRTVIFAHSGAAAPAKIIAARLGVDSTRVLLDRQKFQEYDISLVIGKDYKKLSYR